MFQRCSGKKLLSCPKLRILIQLNQLNIRLAEIQEIRCHFMIGRDQDKAITFMFSLAKRPQPRPSVLNNFILAYSRF